MSDFHSEMTEI